VLDTGAERQWRPRARGLGAAHASSPAAPAASCVRARGCLTPSPGRSLRPSWPPLARCWPRFGILPALGHQRRLRGTGNPSQTSGW